MCVSVRDGLCACVSVCVSSEVSVCVSEVRCVRMCVSVSEVCAYMRVCVCQK